MSPITVFRLIAATLLLLPAFASHADTASTTAAVRIEHYALQLTRLSDIDFGSITPSVTQNGYVTLDPTGSYQVHGGIAAYNPAGAQPAQYTAAGVPYAPITVMFSAPAISLSNGAHTLTVGDFVVENGPVHILSPNGTATFRVGANIYVAAAQMPGSYTGVYSVTVAYN